MDPRRIAACGKNLRGRFGTAGSRPDEDGAILYAADGVVPAKDRLGPQRGREFSLAADAELVDPRLLLHRQQALGRLGGVLGEPCGGQHGQHRERGQRTITAVFHRPSRLAREA